MAIHRDLISAAKKTKSVKNIHLSETGRAIGLGLNEILTSECTEANNFDELLRKLDEVELKAK